MMHKLTIIFIGLFALQLNVSAQLSRKQVHDLQKGKIKEDTSFVYWLPYEHNTRQLMVQGGFSKHSHKYLVAIDFKMKTGTAICAARGGMVISAFQNSTTGGLKDKQNHWNYIIIQHNDGSSAIYGHLQFHGAMVKKGDTILQGQMIGKSGNTGYSAFPHLHFQVWDPAGNQVPVRFRTKKKNRYLKPWRRYKSVHLN